MHILPPHLPASSGLDPDEHFYNMGVACEKAGRFAEALDWHSKVHPGGFFHDSAVASRIAVLLVLNRPREAVSLAIHTLQHLQNPAPPLINEITRAFNVRFGPAEALRLCSFYKDNKYFRNDPLFWWSTAAYAARCGHFSISLDGLSRWLRLRHGHPMENPFLDMDFRPLWHHLAKDRLPLQQAVQLCSPEWKRLANAHQPTFGTISFESIPDVPDNLRAALKINSCSMAWELDRAAPAATIRAYCEWLGRVCQENQNAFKKGLRKAFVILN
jgi:hypothetical protein